MRAYFIDGPAHGHEEAVVGHPHRLVKFPELRDDMPRVYSMRDDWPMSEPGYTIHEYRLLHTTKRRAVYEWMPPRVQASWEFHIRTGSRDADRLYQTLHEGLTKEGEAVQMLSVEVEPGEVRVRGAAVVDGPPDAVAVEEASAAVQAVIDRKLHGWRITGFVVEVSDG